MRVIKIVVEQAYLIHDYESKDLSELMHDWFVRHPLHSSHAYRDASKLGGSEKILQVKEESWDSFVGERHRDTLEKAFPW